VSLFIVATPIGNRSDLTPRMHEVLGSVDLILAEDTRRTRALLSGMDILAPEMMSCHAHNEPGRVATVIARLSEGQQIALVCDAGTPCISDPGGIIVAAVHAAGFRVETIAGPSSITAALAASGFPATPFHFLGFPPRKAGPLHRWLTRASRLDGTLVMLESGRRCGKLVAALVAIMPDREACICRELTKRHETITRAAVGALPDDVQRGEVVMVVGPGAPVDEAQVAPAGPDLKSIAAALSVRWGCSKRDAYRRLLTVEAADEVEPPETR
jgi:16S rRNA (cytidine1402-2'-O)-methyltransferase